MRYFREIKDFIKSNSADFNRCEARPNWNGYKVYTV